MYEDEEAVMKKFAEYDEEIDGLLDIAIEKLQRINHTAQNLQKGVTDQQVLLESLNEKIKVS